MQGLASASEKRCSWCGTLNPATGNACSKCGAAFSSTQQPVGSSAAPAAAVPERSERNRSADYGLVDPARDSSTFEEVSFDAMRSLGLGPTFVSGQAVAFIVAACLSLYVLISVVGALVDISQIATLSNTPAGLTTPPPEVAAADEATLMALMIRVLLIGVALLTGVFFLFWIYRAHKNLKALGATDLKYSPGWAIGGFFIPVLNVVRPYQVVTEIWKASRPGARPPGGIYESTPVFISLWWGLWLLSGFLDFISYVMVFGAGQADHLVVASRYRIVYYVTSVACATLAIAVVLKINARQENANRVNSSTGAGRLAVPEIASDQL